MVGELLRVMGLYVYFFGWYGLGERVCDMGVEEDDRRRGYIQPSGLRELWFHTGTLCNLSCSFCLEGSAPADWRLEMLTWADVEPYCRVALELGVERFSFTGGEPFMVPDMVSILSNALEVRPCLVLTNGTEPLVAHLAKVASLTAKPHRLSFRVSLDHPDPVQHDAVRGAGKFALALETLGKLHQLGFEVSVARQASAGEDAEAVTAAYARHFERVGLPEATAVLAFPDLHRPGAHPEVPFITESCMTTYKTAEERDQFMCAFSKMVVKQDGRMRVYPCTLVDDDREYDQGSDLAAALAGRITLAHHRCYACFASGATCSETHRGG